MRIALVQPSNAPVYDNYKGFNRRANKIPPMGLVYLASFLNAHGHCATVVDAELLGYNFDETVENVLAAEPDLVGFTTTTPIVQLACELAEELKKRSSGIKIVLGGPHSSALPGITLDMCEAIDFIVVGEGERALLELAEKLEAGSDVTAISGLAHRKGGRNAINSAGELIEDLDEIPFPQWRILPYEKYTVPVHFDDKTVITVQTSRGCPFSCTFCTSAIVNRRRVRFRSAKNVVDEVERDVKELCLENIYFIDDTFTLNKRRVIEICEGIAARGLKIKFMCSSRADTIDEERLEYLKKAGLRKISFGIESGDDDVLKSIKKGITVEQAKDAIRSCKKHAIRTHASYILGCPGETLETVRKTMAMSRVIGSDEVQYSIYTPFPGTVHWDEMYRKSPKEALDFSKFRLYGSPVGNLCEVDHQTLVELQKEAYGAYAPLN